ncbi:MAG: hypothetical protein GXY18_04090 [Methanomicrobiales archaeon]|nr:hypothetical protein [Methanomicrobiales archaeon]
MSPQSRFLLQLCILVLILGLCAVFSVSASDYEVDSDTDLEDPASIQTLSPTWTSGNIPLSNLTIEQKEKIRSLKSKPVNTTIAKETPPITVPTDLPEFFDWRDNNGDWTTPVKDQGEECGSCWAHAVIGILESHVKIIEDNPNLNIDLSEQYLLSCNHDDDGCDGGDFETAMPYLVDTPGPDGLVGTVLEQNYPYDEMSDACKDLFGLERFTAGKWAYVNATTESDDAEVSLPTVEELKAAIYLKGPIGVGVDDDDAFDEYSGGIFYSEEESDETNHAVILVGWGADEEGEYFIGKNSIGTEWGEGGWFNIDVHSSRIGEGAVYFDTV